MNNTGCLSDVYTCYSRKSKACSQAVQVRIYKRYWWYRPFQLYRSSVIIVSTRDTWRLCRRSIKRLSFKHSGEYPCSRNLRIATLKHSGEYPCSRNLRIASLKESENSLAQGICVNSRLRVSELNHVCVSYLSNSFQFVVLQESVFGAIIFNIYVNVLDKFKFVLLADDTNILYSSMNCEFVENTVDNEWIQLTNGYVLIDYLIILLKLTSRFLIKLNLTKNYKFTVGSLVQWWTPLEVKFNSRSR